MADRPQGGDLFIVDNSDDDWKVQGYLHDWCQISKTIDIATGYFEIGGLLGLKDEWQKVDGIRILMGDEVSRRTKKALRRGLASRSSQRLDASLEAEKEKNDFLAGVPAIVEAIRSGKIQCRVYTQGQVPRQGLHHPRPAGSGRLLRPGRLVATSPCPASPRTSS